MSTKFLLRRGLSVNVPDLDVGELGFDTDTNTLRIGDGTSNPPKVYTSKTSNLNNILPAVNWTSVLQTPTTLSGYGITDAQPINSTLTKIAALNLSGVEGLLQVDINSNFSFVELGSVESLTGILTISQGGTGASTGAQGLANLGGVSLNAVNTFSTSQIINDSTFTTLSLQSSLSNPTLSPGLSLDRLVSLPNGTAFSQIRFTTLDTGLNVQEAFKLVVTIDNNATGAFASHMDFYMPTSGGMVSALSVYPIGIASGSGNTPQGLGSINASNLFINNLPLSSIFAPIDTTISISNVVGLSDTIAGLVPLSGATMTGPLYLATDPIVNTQAATKSYVDSKVGIYTATPPVGDTPPSNPIANQLWWNSGDGNLYIYFNQSWISAFAVPSVYLGNATRSIPPLQLFVNPVNPITSQVNGAGVWNSGILLGQGYNQLTVSILFTQISTLTIQRYVDQQGQVAQGQPTILSLAASNLQVLNIGDGIPFGSFTVSLQNESASPGLITNLIILLNV